MDISRLIGCILIHLFFTILHCTAIRPPNLSDQTRSVNKIEGEWGKWGAWSTCSVECGTGISSRTRRCEHPLTLPVASLMLRADDSVVCEGGGREIRVCNRHQCPPSVENIRQKQCRKFNARVFNGKKYKWEPYINPNNKCELTCRAKGQHFYARLANRVGDGTPCGLRNLAVCIHRKCLDVGCDNLVGSNAKLDKCGVCKGDNSTCRTISGVFTRPDLPHGYSKIITIPRGSTNINITELRPSTNYLSLKTSNGSIINGDWAISSSGDYDAAGTTFAYKKESLECPGECLYSSGPTNETVELMMLVYHKNPGVVYRFNVPVDVTDAYFKDLISHSDEKHYQVVPVITTTTTTTTTSTLTVPELANLELQGETDVDLDITEVEDVTEAFREEIVKNQENHPDQDVEEGIMKKPQTSRQEEQKSGTYGDRGYTFHEGNGQTVLLKANAGSWLHNSKTSESQSEEGPKFVLSELDSKSQKDVVEDTSFEVVDGDAVLTEGDTMNVEGTEEETIEHNPYNVDNEETEGEKQSDIQEEGIEDGEEIIEQSDEKNKTESAEPSRGNGEEEGIESSEESESIEESEELEHDVENGGQVDQGGEISFQKGEDTEDESEESYDKSRGDETLGLGDDFREPESRPVPMRGGYRLPSGVGVDAGRGAKQGEEEDLPSKPVSTKASPTSTARYTAPSSTVPQRDSRFRTYSRTLGQSDVRPIKRFGRPIARPRNVRIPKYSQSFTFRQRYNHMINAQRKRKLARQRQQLIANSSSSTSNPLNRQISNRRNTQGESDTSQRINQHANVDRSRIQQNVNRGASFPSSGRGYQNRHRHHHRQHQQQQQRPVITTSPTVRRTDNVDNRQSQGLHLGAVSESRSSPGQTRRQGSTSGLGSSVTLKANIGSEKNQGRPTSGHRHQTRDHRLSSGYQARSNRTISRHHQSHRSRTRTSGHQPSVNSRVSPQPFDRAIDARLTVPGAVLNSRLRAQSTDNRRIVDETLALDRFDRTRDPRPTDRRIVIPQVPGKDLPTGRQVINQQPVINSRPRYDKYGSRSGNGEPLTRYAGSVDPVSGLPSISGSATQSLRGSSSITRNVIPTDSRQTSQVVAGGPSNEILGSTYVWRVSGFSDCTTTCGGGVQQTVVVCVDTRNQAVVTDENCGGLRKPTPKAVTCNTRPCPASWQTSSWSSCSKTCGQGIQSRTAACKSRVSATLNLTMPEDSCSQEKPVTTQACEITPCYRWVPGNWSKCSSPCGSGTRQRDVACLDAGDNVVTSQLCTVAKPANQESCDMGSCGKGWYFTDWPSECPASCGEGTMRRKALCSGEDGAPLEDDRCDKLNKPDIEKTCRADTPCGGNWFIGEWSKCNGTCGYALRSRDVVCVKNLPGGILAVVTDDNCKGKDKPETGEECELPQCQSEWYMTSWIQCSKTCGTGHRTREVKCLDPHQQPSGDCPTRGKPRTREPCNTQSCITRPKPTSASGGACKDSFSQCKLVKKARLCRYGYYAKMCCLSCSNET